jgi:putative PIN family toxin of toxin-antitoxin system
MKVFLDTNVLVAAFATRGLCSDLMREVLENHELISSLDILVELKRILIKKFNIPTDQAEDAIDLIHTSSHISDPDINAAYNIKDRDDMPHISAAENAGCNAFVTGDKELWSLNPIGSMQILSPRDFWKVISDRR